jgi:hypothetical protein
MSEKYEYVRESLAALLAGAMASGTAVITALQETPVAEMTQGQWITIGVGGFLAAAQGWKQLLSRPPKRME